MAYLLAGDLGGTKIVLAICEVTADGHRVLTQKRFGSHEYDGLIPMLEVFLSRSAVVPDVAVFGVAGPVLGDTARLTNLGWIIDRKVLQERFRLGEVLLLNDLVAVAHAVPSFTGEQLFAINAGRPDVQGAVAILAPGTGLGEAYLCRDGNRYLPYPSEGGHADFAPTTSEEEGLLRFLRAGLPHVSYEQVCSGIGINNIFRYLTEEAGLPAAPDVLEALAGAGDKTPPIVAHALAGDCVVCVKTMTMFLDILASEAGNLAVKFLATGGVYLGGGILPRIFPLLDPVAFVKRFTAKGRMAELLAGVPVNVIRETDSALLGAIRAGAPLARRRQNL